MFKTSNRPRRLVLLLLAAFVVFAGMQAARPELSNPPVTAELQAPEKVKQILRQSCYDCHSNETHLAWYDKLAPAYWLVVRDVKQGRSRLNFSEIGSMPLAAQKAALFEAVNQIQLDAMPLPSYKRLHTSSPVTDVQLAVLRDYLGPRTQHPAEPQDGTRSEAQYREWIADAGKPRTVDASPNGIPFMAEYKRWKAISSTDRFDNHTVRVILGNDVAILAIADRKINPWPDGTAFAKVAWDQQPGADGVARAGVFLQVEFMIKDAQKYASTKGWGWARWRGTDLKPYGSSPSFSNECIGCHQPVSGNDFVFTMPI